jgi:hypothetical protein
MNLVHKSGDGKDCLIQNLYCTSEVIYKIPPVCFYIRDCADVIIIRRSGETITWSNGDYGAFATTAKVDSITDLIFNDAKDFEENILYLYDVAIKKLISLDYDFTFTPPIYVKDLSHYLMRSYDKKKFWATTTALHDLPVILYTLSHMSSFIKMDAPIDDKIKRFMINLLAVKKTFPIPGLETYELDRITLDTKMSPDYFPKELLADLRVMGEKVIEKRGRGLTSLLSPDIKPEVTEENDKESFAIVPLYSKVEESELISFQDLCGGELEINTFPRDVTIDISIDVNITRMILTAPESLTIFHNEPDTRKLAERILEWFPNYTVDIIDELAQSLTKPIKTEAEIEADMDRLYGDLDRQFNANDGD